MVAAGLLTEDQDRRPALQQHRRVLYWPERQVLLSLKQRSRVFR